MQGNPLVDHLMRAIRRLDLDDDQRASIRSIFQTLKTDSRATMEETKDTHLQLAELIKAENYDEAAVAALAEKEGDLAAERLILSSRALSEVYAQLTPEQQLELENMATERRANKGDRGRQRTVES